MRVRSTGLGKTEMVAGFQRLEPVGNGYIVVEMHATEPVKWRIRVAYLASDVSSNIVGQTISVDGGITMN